jgi:hypothetical protein
MATPSSPYMIPSTIDTFVLNTTLADYNKKLTDNAYDANIFLRILGKKAKTTINGGGSIVRNLIETEQDNGGFYLGSGVLNNTQTNTLTMVEYKWQNSYEPIQLTRDEERQNSGDEHKILDLVGTKTMLSEKAISKRMEQALSVPVGEANLLLDIDTIVNTGTLGSIAGATDTFWQATVTASGAFATQGLSDMSTLFYAISSGATDENPNTILTTKTVFQKYEQTRLPLERISNGDLSFNAGATNLTFKGVPIVYGNYVGSGKLYMLNMNYIQLIVDSATDFITTPFISPTNQTVKVAYILWRGNMVTDNRRRQGKLTSIS